MHAAANNLGTILANVYTALSLTGTGLCVASEATERGAAAGRPCPVFRLPKAPDLKASTYEDAVWENIPWATGFYKLGAFRKVTVQTRFQIGFTEEALHVRVRCEEPDPDRISADAEDGKLVYDNSTDDDAGVHQIACSTTPSRPPAGSTSWPRSTQTPCRSFSLSTA